MSNARTGYAATGQRRTDSTRSTKAKARTMSERAARASKRMAPAFNPDALALELREGVAR